MKEVTDAEKSAYVLMAAGAIWLLIAIVGRWTARRRESSGEGDLDPEGEDE
jgi:hypothetical protein